MSITNPNAIVTEEGLSAFYQAISPYLHGPKKPKVYGFRIDNNESVPSAKVTYLEDAIGMTPAHMDYENDVFNYGSWENAFFMPKPCMLKYDGTVDYYLDPDDYTKKEDGTASDVTNTSYAGNAMMEWGQNGKKIWLKIVPDATADNRSANIYIAEEKIDNDYTDWPFHNSLGSSVDHFYTPIYNGSLINDQLRSLSGQTPMTSGTADNHISYAQANNTTTDPIWNIEVFSDIQLINFLLILIGKSTDTQTVFGQGLTTNGREYEDLRYTTTGFHNDKGLFYGTNSGAANTNIKGINAVKIFGMENWWGFQFRRFIGLIYVNSKWKIKLTYGTEDGSTTTGYNTNGDGYIVTDIPAKTGDSSDGLITTMHFSEYGMLPVTTQYSGSLTTKYCDWFYAYSGKFPRRGNYFTGENKCGAFALDMSAAASESYYYNTSCLSAKPLS